MRLQHSKVDLLHSGTLADVMDGLGHNGTFSSAVRPVNRPPRWNFLGKAYTVRWGATRKSSSIQAPQACTWDQVKHFLAPDCPQGDGFVYVAGTDTGALVTELALAGGFSATDFQTRRYMAMVLGSAIRDAHIIRQLDIPVWATGFVPSDTQGSYRVVETGTWCNVGGQLVQTGDWLFGDETGLIKIPPSDIEKAIGLGCQIEEIEGEILRRVSCGEGLYEVVSELGRL